MADNFSTETVVTPDKVFASDDIAGVNYPILKLVLGALDTAVLASAGAGAVGTGTMRVVLANNEALPPGTNVLGHIIVDSGTVSTITNVVHVDDNAGNLSIDDGGNSITVDGTVTANMGTVTADPFGANADAASATGSISAKLRFIAGTGIPVTGTVAVTESGTWTVQPGNTPNTSAWLTQNTPATSGGFTTAMFSGSDGSSILVATSQVIKASAGQLYGYYCYNPEAAVSFVHFYNTAAASVTVGTTNPLFTIQIPAGSAANLFTDTGIPFSNAGWSCAATTTAGGNGAPATGVSLTVFYK